MCKAQSAAGEQKRKVLRAVEKELVCQGMFYALVCKKGDDRVVGRLTMAK